MRKFSAWLSATALLPCMLSSGAYAQPAPKPAEKAGKAVDEVVVTAAPQSQTRVEIDRRSYDATKSVQAQGGTLSDLLRTVPSVDVDAQGNVSLRGDQNVTIMIDGKPSGMFRGEGRASAVQSLPADQFERVEVITNPSAADSPEGVGGIINLVSKQARGVGGFGSARMTVGTRGQYKGGLSGSYNSAKLALSADLSFTQDDPQNGTNGERRRQTMATGVDRNTVVAATGKASADIFNGRASADYDIDARTRVGAAIRATSVLGDGGSLERTTGSTGATMPIDFSRDIASRFQFDDQEVSGSFRRKLGDDQELTSNARRERLAIRNDQSFRNSFTIPAAPDQYLSSFLGQTINTTGLKVDYKNPLADGELKLGYDGRIDESTMTILLGQGSGPAALALVPGRSGAFDYRLDLHAFYATWSRKMGDLTVLGGLRIEDSKTVVSLPGQRYVVDLTRPYPSLHVSYPLGTDTKITGSYSRRVDRPGAGILNPLTQYLDQQTISRGNPLLRPQETDSFELAYDTRKGQSSLTATAFYRELHDAFTPVVLDQGNGVLLYTSDNLGNVRRAGLSVALTRPLAPKLNLNVSGDGYWTQSPASALGFGQTQSAWVVGGRGSLTWTPTASDLFQVDGRVFGRQITAQGETAAIRLLNLGYRRKLTPSLFVNVVAQNVLDSNKGRITLRTPNLDTVRRFERDDRSVIVTLTYNFGGSGQRRARDPAFDFGSGAAPAGPQ